MVFVTHSKTETTLTETHQRIFSTSVQIHRCIGYNKLGKTGAQYLAKGQLLQLQKLKLSKFDLNLSSCYLTDESIKNLTKAQWPNLRMLDIGILEFNSGGYDGITPQSLAYFEGVSWNLTELGTALEEGMSIHYLSTVVWPSIQLKIRVL